MARETGGTFDTVASTLVKFNKVLQETRAPGSEASAVIKALGLNSEELRRLDPAEALRQTAVALAGFADDGNKARGIQVLFGKSVKEAAAFLKDLSEQTRLVAKVTTQGSDEAEKFNKELFKLEASVTDASRSLALTMVGAINETIDAFRRGAKEGRTFRETLSGEQTKLLRKAFDFGAGDSPSEQFRREGERIKNVIVGVQNTLERDPSNENAARRLDGLRRQLQGVEAQAQEASKATYANFSGVAGAGRGSINPPNAVPSLNIPDEKPDKTKRDAKAGRSGAAFDDGSAELKRQLDSELRLIREFGKQERDAFDFANDYVQGAYAEGNLSLAQYFGEAERLRAGALEAQLAGYDKEIEGQRRLLAATKNPVDRIDASNRIAEAEARRAEAATKASRTEVLAEQQRRQAIEQTQDSYNDLLATLGQLNGNDAGAAAIRIAQQVRDATRLVNQAGGDPAIVGQFKAQLEGAAALAQQQKDYQRLLDSTSAKEADIFVSAQLAGAGELETLAKVRDARAVAITQLDQAAAAARALAQVKGSADAIKFADDLAAAAKRARLELDPLADKLNNMIEDRASDALGDFLTGTKSAKAAFNDFADSVAKDIIRMTAKDFVKSILGGGESGGGIGGFLSGAVRKAWLVQQRRRPRVLLLVDRLVLRPRDRHQLRAVRRIQGVAAQGRGGGAGQVQPGRRWPGLERAPGREQAGDATAHRPSPGHARHEPRQRHSAGRRHRRRHRARAASQPLIVSAEAPAAHGLHTTARKPGAVARASGRTPEAPGRA